jgi:hypothetical protein
VMKKGANRERNKSRACRESGRVFAFFLAGLAPLHGWQNCGRERRVKVRAAHD